MSQILRFPLAVGRQDHFPPSRPLSGNMVVAVSSLILSPESLKKSHGYLVGSPWQWRKQIFPVLLSISFSGMNCLLVAVWLGRLLPTCWRARLSKLQADEVKRLQEGHSSAAEKTNENSSMFPCQPECSLRRAEFGSSSSGCCGPRPFHGERPLDPCSLCMAWLLAPSPSKQKKSKKSQYNQTQYASAMVLFCVKTTTKKRGKKKNN